jgi:hypothetical protein
MRKPRQNRPIEQIACSTRSSLKKASSVIGRAVIETPVTSGANKKHTRTKKIRKKKNICVLRYPKEKKKIRCTSNYVPSTSSHRKKAFKKHIKKYAARFRGQGICISRDASPLHTHALQYYRHMGHRNHLQSHAWPVFPEAALLSI